MANENSGLHSAKRNKKDEFYTQIEDISAELKHYRAHFKDKVVYCNCDDPANSGFFKYFGLNFEFLGLNKLITTCYRSQTADLFSKNDSERALKLEYCGGAKNSNFTIADCEQTLLENDGDFRTEECVEILKTADIIVTNPPFSLFREYVAQLIKFNKKFLIIGHQNAITYKEIFPLIKSNKMWLGFGFKGGAAHFTTADYEDYAKAGDHRDGMIRVSGVVWFTNLDHNKRHEELILVKKYRKNESDYPHYDNYDAIEISKTKDIPNNFTGAMGVPITFLTKFNPDQFEIIGATESEGKGFSNGLWIPGSRVAQGTVNGERVYKRIFIKNRNPILEQ